MYRRLLEGLVQLKVPAPQADIIRRALKEGIRSPNTAYTVLRNSEVAEFLVRYSEHLLVYKDKINVPPFILSVAEVILKKSALGKFMHVYQKAKKD